MVDFGSAQELTMFDSDDLDPEKVLLVHSGDTLDQEVLYAWIGQDAEEDEDDVRDAALEIAQKALGITLPKAKLIIIHEDQEDPDFEDLFVNG